MRQTVYLYLLLALAACGPAATDDPDVIARLPEQVDFNFHVKPLLSDRCFTCHGPDENARKADLRLDTRDGPFARLESGGRAVVSGSLRRSRLAARITSPDPDFMMPPPESNLQLSAYERALILRWIEQGAEWKPHWAFLPPEKPVSPADRGHPIDHFVRARLAPQGLDPSPEADRETLLRRVTFHLTGLPPTIEEIDAFLADTLAGAYERVVDRLLASPHYGERMAVDWLDLARYADSHGYQDDGFRFVWPWRDWVVRAFNANMSYDRFLTWQLAGDLLPNATQEQRLATTFLRNHRINSEAGIVDEEYRVEYVADRTHTVGRALMGMTVECARCHDHKYDPISQREYYRLFAFFNNVREMGEIANDGNPGPLMPLTDAAVDAQIAALRTRMAEKEAEMETYAAQLGRPDLEPPSPQDLARSLRRGLLYHLSFESSDEKTTPNSARPSQPGMLSGAPEHGEGPVGRAAQLRAFEQVSLGRSTAFERTQPFTVGLWIHPAQSEPYVPVWGNPGNKNLDFKGVELYLKEGRPHVRLCHAIPHNYLEVHAAEAIPLDAWTHVAVTYDGSSRAGGLRIFVDGRPAPTEVDWDNLYKSVRRDGLRIGGQNARGGFDGGRVDEVHVYDRRLSALEVAEIAGRDGSGEGRARLEEYVRLSADPTYGEHLQELEALREREHAVVDTLREIMVMEEMPVARPTYVLERGVYDAPAEAVQPGTPVRILPFPEELPPNRLGLARWLTHPDHPLTARVAVNRLWQQLFGRGLVATPGDWGNQGALPTHPALLDWLAATFVDSGWDVKALLKRIVLSDTYRQASYASDALRTADPDNRWLARGPTVRLPAEMIRDQALAASGLLVRRPGGRPVKPYQPPGLWKEIAAIRNSLSEYEQDHGENLYRRSLYTLWKRTAPPPALAAFDAPTRELCEVQRQQTSTPLQALVLWNDPQFVEAARVLAERTFREAGPNTGGRIVHAFRLLTGRHPTSMEQERLLRLFQDQHAAFQADPARARALLAVGEYPRDPAFDAAELAATTQVVQALMSYDDVVTLR